DRLGLIREFVVIEKEKLVLDERPGHPEARITPRKERVRINRVSLQVRIRRHIVVAKEEITATMKVVAARPGYDINRARARDAGGNIEVYLRELKFLNNLLREIHGIPAGNRIINRNTIDHEAHAASAPA